MVFDVKANIFQRWSKSKELYDLKDKLKPIEESVVLIYGITFYSFVIKTKLT